MTTTNKMKCAQGHEYVKSSDCHICENERKPQGFFYLLPSSARRALTRYGITTRNQLATYSEKEILSLHGIDPTSLLILRQRLKTKNLAFKKK